MATFKELVVLSIFEEDIEQHADELELEELKEKGLIGAAMEKAREYMWDAIDSSDFFSDCINEAIGNVIEWS